MTPESEDNLRLEIGHVLFIDIVGYSKLLIEEQKERLRQLTDIVLATAQVARQPTSNSLGCRPATEWRWSFAIARKSRRAVRSKSRRRLRRIPRLESGWACTVGR